MTSSTTRRSVLGLLGAGAAGTALAAAPDAAYAAPPADLRAGGAFDRFVAERAAQDLFSGTVLLAHRGRPVLARSYGLANRDRALPNTAHTIFGLASVTKTFTALAVAQLVQQGRMGFHDPVGAHLDGFPADVTVHHLLTHTSGVGRPAIGSGPPSGLDWDSFEEVMDGTLAIIRQTPVQFPAGTRHVYSNDGFTVLGAIVARVAGQSYFDYVGARIFAPAGMSRSAFYTRPQVLADDRIARPYWTQRDGTRADFTASPYAPFTIGPPGGAYATAGDLLAFAGALTAGRLLSPAYTGLLTGGKVALPPGEPAAAAEFYGYGYREAVVNGRRVFGHSGGGPGMATRLDIFPELGWVAIVLSNYDTTVNPIVERARHLITS